MNEYNATNPKAVAHTQEKPELPIEETKTVDGVTYIKRGGIWYTA